MKLIEGWKQAHKFASVRVAALAGLAAGYFAAYPEQLAAVMGMIPEWARPVLGFAIFAAAAGSRVTTFKGDQT